MLVVALLLLGAAIVTRAANSAVLPLRMTVTSQAPDFPMPGSLVIFKVTVTNLGSTPMQQLHVGIGQSELVWSNQPLHIAAAGEFIWEPGIVGIKRRSKTWTVTVRVEQPPPGTDPGPLLWCIQFAAAPLLFKGPQPWFLVQYICQEVFIPPTK